MIKLRGINMDFKKIFDSNPEHKCKAVDFVLASLLIFSLTALISSAGFIFGLEGGAYGLIFAFCIVILYGLLRDRALLPAVFFITAAVVICCFAASFIYDTSYDGMYFHKEAARTLAQGWDPLYTSFSDISKFSYCQDLHLWLDNYPKGVWSLYAGIYSLCGRIEAAKGANILFVIMLFSAAYDVCFSVFSLKSFPRVIISAAFAAHPVILSQFFTYYNDLPVAALVMVCGFGAMKIYAGKAERIDYICTAAAFASSFAVKFTAPVFCGSVILTYIIFFALKKDWVLFKKTCIVFCAAAFVGVCVLGTDPYIKHLLNGQNPVFPLLGAGKYDIMNTNLPKGFEDISGIKQLFISLFSRSNQDIGANAEFKIPFTFNIEEFNSLGAADVRLGGFGVLFGGIVILSLPAAAVCLVKGRINTAALPAILVFILLALFFPETWWARYNPYIYYIPCLIALMLPQSIKNAVPACLLSAVLIVNGFISLTAVSENLIHNTKIVKESLAEIKNENKPVLLRINDFPSHSAWFDEMGIEYEISYKPLDEPIVFYKTTKYQFKENSNEENSR